MEEKLINVLNEMANYLSISQLKKLQEVLLKYLSDEKISVEEISNQEYLNERTDDNPALFVSLDKPHERLRSGGVELRMRKLGEKQNLPKIHPHKFRRTMASRAIDKGMPVEQVQKILGHSQINTTMGYCLVNQSNVKESHRKYMT